MKTTRVLILVALLAAAVASVAVAEGFSLEAGGIASLYNATSSQQATASVITSQADFSPDLYVNFNYTMKIDDSTKMKFGLLAEDMMGTVAPSFVNIARTEPYADLSWGGLSARVSFPLYFLGYDPVNDPAYKEIGYILDKAYKGINLSTVYTPDDYFLFTNFESVAYKWNIDKTTALVFSATTEIGFVPAFWVYDVKPQVSVIWGPLQLDLKESIYFVDASMTPMTTDAAYNTRFFTDPKLTFNFASIGVAGLKAYVGASLYTANVSASGTNLYGTGTGGNAAFGSSITPGVSYANGPFYVEAAFKCSNYDDTLSSPPNKNPTFDPSLKFSYTFSF